MTARHLITWVAGMAAFSWIPAGIALADDPMGSISQDRQAKLLEKFGDKGIDSDFDGQLTRGDVRSFFGTVRPRRGEGKGWRKGHRGGHGSADRGPRWMGRLLRRLERLDFDSPPADCNPDWVAQADADGDGKVSDSEWAAFAEQVRQQLLAELLSIAPEADADKNGQIDNAELDLIRTQHTDRMRSRILNRHPQADTDSDGTLSDEELASFRATRGPHQRPGRRCRD
ncbi:MAG: hypothetical protein JSU63_13920 [Phycisphaerales bacterium]|nr:MAG: hypothetical protein JSU63_13920 [Phycisphaerales bacterium]